MHPCRYWHRRTRKIKFFKFQNQVKYKKIKIKIIESRNPTPDAKGGTEASLGPRFPTGGGRVRRANSVTLRSFIRRGCKCVEETYLLRGTEGCYTFYIR